MKRKPMSRLKKYNELRKTHRQVLVTKNGNHNGYIWLPKLSWEK